MPEISVILCAYNAAETLGAAVRSVLNQTQRNIELIIVNDGSRDSTRAVASQFCQEDPRVKLVNIENGGLSNARNVGMAEAKGEFIAFCDADDTLDEKAFETMLNAVRRDETDMVICGYHHDTVTSDGSISTVDFFEPQAVYLERRELFCGLVGLKSKFILDASWNKLFRRSVIVENDLKMQVGELFEDTAFVLSFLECSCRATVLSDCFYHYVQRANGSITKSYDARKLRDLKKRYRQLAEFTADADESVKRFVDLYYVKNIFSCLANSYSDTEMTAGQRKALMRLEFKSEDFKKCAKNAKGFGKAGRVTVAVARLGLLWPKKLYCRAIHYMKTRAAVAFAKMK